MTTPTKTTRSRRSVIEGALNESLRPKPPGGRPITQAEWRAAAQLTPLQLAGEIVRREPESAVGGMTKLLYRLSPADQQAVRHAVNLLDHHKELGRHGNPKKVLEHFNVDPAIADAVHAGLEKDYVAAELMRRRRKQNGDNSDLELPALTRRDHLEAAVDAHMGDDSDSDNDDGPAEMESGRSWTEQPRATRDDFLARARKGG